MALSLDASLWEGDWLVREIRAECVGVTWPIPISMTLTHQAPLLLLLRPHLHKACVARQGHFLGGLAGGTDCSHKVGAILGAGAEQELLASCGTGSLAGLCLLALAGRLFARPKRLVLVGNWRLAGGSSASRANSNANANHQLLGSSCAHRWQGHGGRKLRNLIGARRVL